MIPRNLFVMFLLACPGLVTGQVPTAEPPTQGQTNPDRLPVHLVKFDEREPAMRGRARPGELVRRTVPIENVSAGEVRVRVVGTTCPCTTGTIEPEVIRPGETTRLVLTARAADVGGPQLYHATIEAVPQPAAAGAASQRHMIAVGYRPDVDVRVWPRQSTISVVAGEPEKLRWTLRVGDGRDRRVSRVATPPWLKLQAQYPEAGSGLIELEFQVGADQPSLFGGSIVASLDDNDEDTAEAVVGVRVIPRVIARPAGVVWMPNANHDPVSVRLEMRPGIRGGSQPAEVKLVPSTDRVVMSPLRRIETGWEFTVRFVPGIAENRPHGSCEAQVLGTDGSLLRAIKIVWFESLEGASR